MQTGKLYFKGRTAWSQGDVMDIVGIIGDIHGSLTVCFSTAQRTNVKTLCIR